MDQFLILYLEVQLLQHYLTFAPLSKSSHLYMCRSISGLSILLHHTFGFVQLAEGTAPFKQRKEWMSGVLGYEASRPREKLLNKHGGAERRGSYICKGRNFKKMIWQRKVGYCCWHTDSCSAVWDWAEVDCKRVKEELWCGCVRGVPGYTEQDLSTTRSSQTRPKWVLSLCSLWHFTHTYSGSFCSFFCSFPFHLGSLKANPIPHSTTVPSTVLETKETPKKMRMGLGGNHLLRPSFHSWCWLCSQQDWLQTARWEEGIHGHFLRFTVQFPLL